MTASGDPVQARQMPVAAARHVLAIALFTEICPRRTVCGDSSATCSESSPSYISLNQHGHRPRDTKVHRRLRRGRRRPLLHSHRLPGDLPHRLRLGPTLGMIDHLDVNRTPGGAPNRSTGNPRTEGHQYEKEAVNDFLAISRGTFRFAGIHVPGHQRELVSWRLGRNSNQLRPRLGLLASWFAVVRKTRKQTIRFGE